MRPAVRLRPPNESTDPFHARFGRLRIAVAEGQRLGVSAQRYRPKQVKQSPENIEVVAEAGNGLEALEKAREFNPDLLIMDVRMPVMTGLDACGLLSGYAPRTKALILSMHDSEDYVLQSLKAGAWGYLLKDIDRNEFIKALKQVHAGTRYYSGAVSNVLASQLLTPSENQVVSSVRDDPYGLTRREKEILRLVINGNQNKQIAE